VSGTLESKFSTALLPLIHVVVLGLHFRTVNVVVIIIIIIIIIVISRHELDLDRLVRHIV